MYALAAGIIAVEMLLGIVDTEASSYKLLYSVSLSGFNFGLNAGILDLKVILQAVYTSAMLILLTVWVIERRGEEKRRNRKCLVGAVALASVVAICIGSPTGAA